jgi:hypothetical protein
MDANTKQAFIRRIAHQNRNDPEQTQILWSRHGIMELTNEQWSRSQVEQALQNSMLIEDYPQGHRRLPDCLVSGWLVTGEPFHAVIALDENKDRLLIVTVYQPDPKEWEDDWQTRKR